MSLPRRAALVSMEMVQLASQLVQRQSGQYDAADLEDKYTTRLRAMIHAKLKGEGIDANEPEEPERTNVFDLMAALKKSLAQATDEKKLAPAKKKAAATAMPIKRRQEAAAKRKGPEVATAGGHCIAAKPNRAFPGFEEGPGRLPSDPLATNRINTR